MDYDRRADLQPVLQLVASPDQGLSGALAGRMHPLLETSYCHVHVKPEANDARSRSLQQRTAADF